MYTPEHDLGSTVGSRTNGGRDGMAREPQSAMGHDDWIRTASEEYRRLIVLLEGLEPDAWTLPTDCDGWAVRDVVAHLVGAGEWPAKVRELLRQMREGRRLLPDEDGVDGMNAVQVRERADHPPARLLADLRDVAPRAVRARARLPRLIRALPMRFGPPLGTKPLGYLTDRILTRDAWLHRVDLSRATGRHLELTADHDAPLVADVVAEWAALHGEPFDLTLTGTAGGRWRHGEGGARLEVDAVEFCRILSGRAAGTGLLATRVNF